MNKNPISEQPVFLVVGSDTAVGKTVFSGLFGLHLKRRGVHVRLIKPFCSGGRGDIKFLAQCGALSEAVVNFWYDDEPVSPAAWELSTGDQIDFDDIVEKLRQEFKRNDRDIFIVEGVGGLLAPITLKHTIASLAQELSSKLIIIAQNRVGVINHVLLTLEAALSRGLSVASVILMEQEKPDSSAVDNAELIRIHMSNTPAFKGIFEFPWLGKGADNPDLIVNNIEKADSVLKEVFDVVIKPYFFATSNN